MEGDINLNIITLNVRGMCKNVKRTTIFNWLKSKKADIICLQETFCTQNNVEGFNFGWKGKSFHSLSNSAHSRGVCIMINNNINIKVINIHSSEDGRKILINIKHKEVNYTICSLYAPNNVNNRKTFLDTAYTWISRHTIFNSKIIIGADMNTCLTTDDRTSLQADPVAINLKRFCQRLRLTDAWTLNHNETSGYTYINPGNANIQSRIDYILTSNTMNEHITQCEINNSPAPDHKALEINIQTKSAARGKSYWKMNTSVITEESYNKLINKVIKETFENYKDQLSIGITWDLCKIKIKESTIRYCTKRQKLKANKINELEKILATIDASISSLTNDTTQANLLGNKRKQIKDQINQLYYEKTKGYQIRSKAKWIEEGEHSTSYFLGLEKQRQENNAIKKLQCCDGNIAKTDSDILKECTSFYQKLYTSKNPNPEQTQKYIDQIRFKNKLNEVNKQKCEGLITQEECRLALKQIKLNKSPGFDGIPGEFYIHFWPILGTFLVKVFNESFHKTELTESQKIAILSLIYKKGDKDLLKNYRPISLTNIDYKILAFTLANRLHKVLDQIIGIDQNGYVKKRFIGYNIRIVEDIIFYSNKYDIKGLMAFLDFEKAFDSLEWDFMMKMLKQFNFGEEFIQWIKNPIL